MCPWRIRSPSSACLAGSVPMRDSILGSRLVAYAGKCTVTNTAAGRSAGRCRTTVETASTPPADAPITMMSRIGAPLSAAECSGFVGLAGRRKSRALREPQRDPRPLADDTSHEHVAAHRPRETAADREAEAAAAGGY